MIPTLKPLEIQFGKVSPPSQDILEAIRKLKIKHIFPPHAEQAPIFSADACRLLLQTQPLILHKREVVGNLRTYWMCKTKIPETQDIYALKISSKMDRSEIVNFSQNIFLLAAATNSVIKAAPSLYASAFHDDNFNFSTQYLNLFKASQKTVASTLGITIKTLKSRS